MINPIIKALLTQHTLVRFLFGVCMKSVIHKALLAILAPKQYVPDFNLGFAVTLKRVCIDNLVSVINILVKRNMF